MRQAKNVESQQHRVCMLCGKPSPESICEQCKSKVQGENLRKKIQTDKAGKD
jgi:hypothetical protein